MILNINSILDVTVGFVISNWFLCIVVRNWVTMELHIWNGLEHRQTKQSKRSFVDSRTWVTRFKNMSTTSNIGTISREKKGYDI